MGLLYLGIGVYMEEDIRSCIYCRYADENYHDWKLYCVRHDCFLNRYSVCEDYDEY